jgi:hypothetical protein
MEEYGFVKESRIQEVQNLRGSGTGTLLYTIAFLHIHCEGYHAKITSVLTFYSLV